MNKRFYKIKNNHLYFILYLISNLFIILNYQGLYWDDWVAYNQDQSTINNFFGMIQHGVKGDFFILFSKFFNGIYGFHIFYVIAYPFIGYSTYNIFNSLNIFTKCESKLIGFLSIIVPIYSSFVAISIVPFLFPVVLFYVAFYLLTKYYESSNVYLRILILLLFFISFSTNSLLVFYGIVLIYIYYMENYGFRIDDFKLMVIKKIDFILIPIIYFVYKKLALIPFEVYANYNEISIDNVLRSFAKIPSMYFSIPYHLIVDIEYNILCVILIISSLLTFIVKIKIKIFDKLSNVFLMFILSIILFIFAAFPYLAVGKTPVLYGWNSRFLLLFNISIIMIYLSIISFVSILFKKYQKKVFLFLISTIILLFVYKNISFQYKQNLDWFYQVSIIQNFKNNDQIKDNSTFVIHNKINNQLLYKRIFVFYEWNGLLKKAFHNTKRLMIPPSYIKLLHRLNGSRTYKQYNFYQWNQNLSYINVYLEKGISIDFFTLSKLYYYYVFNYNEFLELSKKITIIKIDN